jgi:WD40 repeat protein
MASPMKKYHRAIAGSWWKEARPRAATLKFAPASRRFKGHAGAVRALCVLAERRLVSAADDGTIRLWDLATCAEVACLQGHNGSVDALCVLADGRLASGSSDGTIRLWDLSTSAETARIEITPVENGTWWVTALCTLPDGRLAFGDSEGTIRLWDPATGVEIARLDIDARVACLSALTDTRLVAGDQLGRLHWLEVIE